MFPNVVVGFVGGGAMGSAIAEGLVAKGFPPARLVIADVVPETRAALAKRIPGATILSEAKDVSERADVIFLCVKPHLTGRILGSMRLERSRHILISVAAGVLMDDLEQQAAVEGLRVVRSMPNTGCLVGTSATTIYPNKYCSKQDVATVLSLYNAAGITVPVTDEKLLNAATGVAGSGIAYVYLFIEALADGGVYAGLPRPLAQQLAAQTVLGGARMVLKGGTHPGVLKDQVCSPGGTTIAAVKALEKGAFRHTVIDAVATAAAKAEELGKPKAKL